MQGTRHCENHRPWVKRSRVILRRPVHALATRASTIMVSPRVDKEHNMFTCYMHGAHNKIHNNLTPDDEPTEPMRCARTYVRNQIVYFAAMIDKSLADTSPRNVRRSHVLLRPAMVHFNHYALKRSRIYVSCGIDEMGELYDTRQKLNCPYPFGVDGFVLQLSHWTSLLRSFVLSRNDAWRMLQRVTRGSPM